MQLPFFFQENISNNPSNILSEETSRHCVQVLRMKAGNSLQLTDGKGNLFTALITHADKKNCEVKIEESIFEQQQLRKISIGISLLKNQNRFEWFFEKATEIGVYEIIPLLCKRTERLHFREERMKNILIAAMIQSRQCWLPILQNMVVFENLISSSAHTQKFIAHCMQTKKQTLKEFNLSNDIQILIGPEGDFSEDEILLSYKKNYIPVSLGNTRLRTETAALTAATLLMNL